MFITTKITLVFISLSTVHIYNFHIFTIKKGTLFQQMHWKHESIAPYGSVVKHRRSEVRFVVETYIFLCSTFAKRRKTCFFTFISWNERGIKINSDLVYENRLGKMVKSVIDGRTWSCETKLCHQRAAKRKRSSPWRIMSWETGGTFLFCCLLYFRKWGGSR